MFDHSDTWGGFSQSFFFLPLYGKRVDHFRCCITVSHFAPAAGVRSERQTLWSRTRSGCSDSVCPDQRENVRLQHHKQRLNLFYPIVLRFKCSHMFFWKYFKRKYSSTVLTFYWGQCLIFLLYLSWRVIGYQTSFFLFVIIPHIMMWMFSYLHWNLV